MDKQNKSALREQEGISQNELTNSSSIESIKQKRKTQPTAEDLISKILKVYLRELI